MAKAESDIELDEDGDFLEEDDTDETDETELLHSSKTNLTRRRQSDEYLEERRLQKQLDEFDFD